MTRRSVTLWLLALSIAALGEGLLFLAELRWLGFALLLVAMALAAAASARPAAIPPPPDRRLPLPASRWRLAAMVGALLLALGSLVTWFADPDATFGVQGILWLAGIATLVAACARWRAGAAGTAEAGPAWTRLEVGAFLAVVALALFTYLADLNDVPWRFHYDEVIAYDEAMRFHRGRHISVFTTTWFDTGLPSMWFAISAAAMHLVGTDLGGVRFSVALAGALTVVPVYGLGRLVAGRAAAVLAAFAWATTPVAIHYSRVSILNMTTAFFWAACFFFLLRGLRSRAPLDFALSGLVAGLSMYTYYGTRLLPVVLLVFCGYLVVVHRQAFRESRAQLALLPVGFFVGFGPLLAYFLRNPDVWAGRGLSLLVDWTSVVSLAGRNFLGLSVIRSNDHVYWDALLPPAEAVLLLLGVGVLVRRWREPGAFLTLLWGLSVLVVGGTLVGAGHIPAFAHWTPAFPAFFLAIAVVPALLLESLRRARRRWWGSGCAVVGAGMLALAGVNAHTYLVTYPASVPPSFEAAQGRFLAGLTANERVRFVGNSWQPFYPTIGEMMAPRVGAGDLLNPSRSLPVVPRNQKEELIFVFHDDQIQYLPLIERYYPQGVRGRLETPGGSIAQTYRVAASQALSRHGARLTVGGARGGSFWEGNVRSIGDVPAAARRRLPATATWSGFFFTEAREVRFAIEGADAARLRVQGAPVSPGARLPVDPGWVAFALRARLTRQARVRVLLREGASPPAALPRERLWPARASSGLAVTLRGPATTTRRIDPFVGASVLGSSTATGDRLLRRRDPDFVPLAPRGERVELVRWEGQLYAAGGTYRLELRTDADARLYVGGKLVLDLCDNEPPENSVYLPGGYLFVPGGYPASGAAITLTRRWHPVRLDLHATGGNSGLEWAWTRPDGVREIVPPHVLRQPVGKRRTTSKLASIECGTG